MKEIPLTQGKIALVDDDVYEQIKHLSWFYQKVSYKDDGYACHRIRTSRTTNITIYMHRLIMNCPPNMQVDHINSFRTDNRKENLRICTQSLNAANKAKNKSNPTSQFKGVHFCQKSKRYIATLRCNKKLVLSKRYLTEIEAALSYNESAKKHLGAFAYLNEVPDDL